MKFRNPDAQAKNLLFLLPVYLLVVVIGLVAYIVYRYLTGQEDDVFWLGLGAGMLVYFIFRSWFAVRHVFVWGEDAEDE